MRRQEDGFWFIETQFPHGHHRHHFLVDDKPVLDPRDTGMACDERNEKGKLCAGHLKRWYDLTPEVEAMVGKGAEIYRCEFCKILFRPDPKQQPNSLTLRY